MSPSGMTPPGMTQPGTGAPGLWTTPVRGRAALSALAWVVVYMAGLVVVVVLQMSVELASSMKANVFDEQHRSDMPPAKYRMTILPSSNS